MASCIRLAAGLVALGCASTAAQAATAPSAVRFDDRGAVADALIDGTADPAAGATVISSKGLGNCVACHSNGAMPDVAFQGEIGPSLDGVADRWSEAELRSILVDAKRMFPGTIMPSFYKTDGFVRPGDGFTGKAAPAALDPLLTARQVEDTLAYLMTLRED